MTRKVITVAVTEDLGTSETISLLIATIDKLISEEDDEQALRYASAVAFMKAILK